MAWGGFAPVARSARQPHPSARKPRMDGTPAHPELRWSWVETTTHEMRCVFRVRYWQPLKASVGTRTGVPATGVSETDCNSDTVQSTVPPD